jgi:hypothetical protein
MNDDRDLNRLLDAWFAEGPVQAADRVIDGAAGRIASQRQTPAWRLRPWRFPTMSTTFKLVAIGAALLAALVGGALLAGGGARIAPPAPTPAPSPTPAPTPAPMALKPGPLAPGTYLIRPYKGNPLTWTVTVPAGWRAYEDWALVGPELPGNIGTALTLTEKVAVPADSCRADGTPPAATVDAFIASVKARHDWLVSEPADIAVGGYTGRRIDIELPANIGTCGSNTDYFVTAEDGKGGFYAQAPSNRFTFWALDVKGTPKVLMRSTFAAVPAREISETDAMVESSLITP